MRIVDSHCHLNYLDDPAQAVAAALAADVETMLCIGVEQERICEVLACADRFPGVWASIGEHPGVATGNPDWIAEYLDHPRVVAIGETGLDYFYETSAHSRALQQDGFRYQMNLARELDLPVIIHTRSAVEDTLATMAEFPDVVGVLHCFTESWEMAEQALAMGYYISISGIVTFNKAVNVRMVAERVPDNRLLIETDAPWLAPVPNRGQQNQPAFVVDTARCIAQLRGQSLSALAELTRDNFFSLFNRAA